MNRFALRCLTAIGLAADGIQRCGVNLSGQSLTNDEFFVFLTSAMRDLGPVASKFCFEITETAVVSNLTHAKQFFTRLKSRGARFALDDFGRGAGVFGVDHNHREINVGKLVDFEVLERKQAQHHQGQHEHGGEDRIVDRDLGADDLLVDAVDCALDGSGRGRVEAVLGTRRERELDLGDDDDHRRDAAVCRPLSTAAAAVRLRAAAAARAGGADWIRRA